MADQYTYTYTMTNADGQIAELWLSHSLANGQADAPVYVAVGNFPHTGTLYSQYHNGDFWTIFYKDLNNMVWCSPVKEHYDMPNENTTLAISFDTNPTLPSASFTFGNNVSPSFTIGFTQYTALS